MRMERMAFLFIVMLALVTFPQLLPADDSQGAPAFELKSPAFNSAGKIPLKYTCEGEDVSPPLAWSDAPQATRSFALICDDPDAPLMTWVHWVYYDIPATVKALPEAISPVEKPAPGGIHGKNSYHKPGYRGPCPPWGTHRYFFKLYALDTVLNLNPSIPKKDLLKAMEGHILGQAELMGTYKKK